MMPMGIASFSFDLFGITRRENIGALQPLAMGERLPRVEVKAMVEPETKEVAHRDYEHVFWGMFPVL